MLAARSFRLAVHPRRRCTQTGVCAAVQPEARLDFSNDAQPLTRNR